MPLVLISGRPCTGKSTVAAQLRDAFTDAGCDVMLVDEPSLHLDKNEAHGDAAVEKTTRGLLKAAVERALTRQRDVVILDSINGIKGYRYELYCAARAAATRYCVVHLRVPVDAARSWNDARAAAAGAAADSAAPCTAAAAAPTLNELAASSTASAVAASDEPQAAPAAAGAALAAANGAAPSVPATSAARGPAGPGGHSGSALGCAAYGRELFEDLAGRFEEPDPRNRWDAPLFELDPSREGPDAAAALVSDVVAAITGKGGEAAGPRARAARTLTPTCATASAPLAETNVLHGIDRSAQEVLRTVCAAQVDGAGGAGPRVVLFGEGLPPLRLARPVPLAELRSHKRAFMKVATQVLGGQVRDATSAKRLFIEFLQGKVGAGGL